MSSSQRDKGCRGENEARSLLIERGFEVIETSRGLKCEDIYASLNGCHYAVEVKWREIWDLKAWRRQAKDNAAKRKCSWLLMVRITAWPHHFYVEGRDRTPTVWRGNAGRLDVA